MPVLQTGIDHANGVNPPPVSAVASHVPQIKFACRYISGETTSYWTKIIRAPEAHALSSAGIKIVLVFERDGHQDLAGGGAAGQKYGKMCLPIQRDLGWTTASVVYCAIDWDATLGGYSNPGTPGWANMTTIAEFGDGWAQAQGKYPGFYGSFYALDALKRLRPNTFRYGWQTYAWSAGHWQAWAQLRQVAANQYIGGVNCDIDEAWSTDYGGYIWGSSNRFANEPTIRLGANDRNYPVGVHPIKDLQNALNSAFGAGLVVDGAFGSATESAVRRFQAAALGGELTADGIVGPFTWAKLDLILDWQGKK